jgi:hypothetical protein
VKLVKQTGSSDCLQACVASVLELEIGEMPELNPMDEDSWTKSLHDFLLPMGLGFIWATMPVDPHGITIGSFAAGTLSRREHCCVMINGELAWDPRGKLMIGPDDHSIHRPQSWILFTALDPSSLHLTSAISGKITQAQTKIADDASS